KKYAEKGAEKRAADQMAQYFRRLVDCTHCLDDAKDSSNDAKGGKCICHYGKCMCRAVQIFRNHPDLFIHKGFYLMRLCGAEREGAQIVAKEGDGARFCEHGRILLKDRAVVRALDRGFEVKDALSANGAQKREHEAEKVEEVFLLQAPPRENIHQRAACIFDHLHGVCGKECRKRCAADDENFEGLPENGEMAAHAGETAQHGDEEEGDSDDEAHCACPVLER